MKCAIVRGQVNGLSPTSAVAHEHRGASHKVPDTQRYCSLEGLTDDDDDAWIQLLKRTHCYNQQTYPTKSHTTAALLSVILRASPQLAKRDENNSNCMIGGIFFVTAGWAEIRGEFQEEGENSVSLLASIPFKLNRNVLWVLKCRFLSHYTPDGAQATQPSSCSFLPCSHFLPSSPLFHLSPSPFHAEENLSFIVKVMLSHLSQSLLLSCCIPSPSPPSLPVHLHTLLTGMYVHINACSTHQTSICMYTWRHFRPCVRPKRSPHVFIVSKFKDLCFAPFSSKLLLLLTDLHNCNFPWQGQYILLHHSLNTPLPPLLLPPLLTSFKPGTCTRFSWWQPAFCIHP